MRRYINIPAFLFLEKEQLINNLLFLVTDSSLIVLTPAKIQSENRCQSD